MKRFEYMVELDIEVVFFADGAPLDAAPSLPPRVNARHVPLNELGAQGWELCARHDHAFYFKREIEMPKSVED